MLGTTVCQVHGGAARQVRAKAQERQELDRIDRFLAATGVDATDPLEGLLEEIARSAAAVSWLSLQIADVERASPHKNENVVLKLWSQERDRHARLCKMALDVGIAERQVRIAELQAQRLGRALLAALTDPDVGLSLEQQEIARRVAARNLRALGA